MKKADESTHDVLVTAICENKNNASLYKALTDIQRTIQGVTTQINETIAKLNELLKNYQLEFNFNYDDDDNGDAGDENESKSSDTFRGTKKFIEEMKKETE